MRRFAIVIIFLLSCSTPKETSDSASNLTMEGTTDVVDDESDDDGTADGTEGDGGDDGGTNDGGTEDEGAEEEGAEDEGVVDGGAEEEGAEDDGSADEGSADDATPVAPTVVRFVALGDGGEGNEAQYAVADAMNALCESKTDEHGPGCEFALYLGDNFYNEGVESVDDPQFETKFELPYADITFPFYVVLGNHDYGVTSLDIFRAPYQVEYSDRSTKWVMPNEFYTKRHEHALFVGLDTNAIMVEDIIPGDHGQASWLSSIHATNDATWTIGFGHHPYISNGRHGNAGWYEGIPFIPVVSGETVKDFFDDHICGKVDIYISGHDHNRQWLNPTCGTEFIVSGAASKTTDLEGRGTPTFWEDDTTEGFLWVELRDNVMVGEFYDRNGTFEYTHTVTK